VALDRALWKLALEEATDLSSDRLHDDYDYDDDDDDEKASMYEFLLTNI
jgi:hypothetical protein